MKAFVIKNKEGKYVQYFDANSDDIGFTDDLTLAMFYDKNEKDIMEKAYSNMEWEYPEITITEGDLEKENKELKERINDLADIISEYANGALNDFAVKQLKKQLAEKDKETEVLKEQVNMYKSHVHNYYQQLQNYRDKIYKIDVKKLMSKKLTPEQKEIYYKGFANCERQISSNVADIQIEERKKVFTVIKDMVQRLVRISPIYNYVDFMNLMTEIIYLEKAYNGEENKGLLEVTYDMVPINFEWEVSDVIGGEDKC